MSQNGFMFLPPKDWWGFWSVSISWRSSASLAESPPSSTCKESRASSVGEGGCKEALGFIWFVGAPSPRAAGRPSQLHNSHNSRGARPGRAMRSAPSAPLVSAGRGPPWFHLGTSSPRSSRPCTAAPDPQRTLRADGTRPPPPKTRRLRTKREMVFSPLVRGAPLGAFASCPGAAWCTQCPE